MNDRYTIAELSKDEWEALQEYDKTPPTQEEQEDQRDALAFYRGHEWKRIGMDEAVVNFWKL